MTAFAQIDQQLAARRRAARAEYNRHVIEVARGGRIGPDLDIALRADVTIDKFKAHLAREAEEWELTKRIRELEHQIESHVQPEPGEAKWVAYGAADPPGEWVPWGLDFHGGCDLESREKFNAFMEKRRLHEERKVELRAELETCRAELTALKADGAEGS